jgi:actin-related protein
MEEQPIVIDTGSFSIKAGYVGQDAPVTEFRTVIGRPRGWVGKYWAGHEAIDKAGQLQITYPFAKGVINNWHDMELLWQTNICYNELRIAPEEHKVLLTEHPLTSDEDRAKKVQFVFENMNSPGLLLANQAVLALIASGKTTGVVLDCGHTVSHAVPIVDGVPVPNATVRSEFGGKDVNEMLLKKLQEKGIDLSTKSFTVQQQDRTLKESFGFVAEDYNAALETSASGSTLVKTYDSDGYINPIELNNERFKPSEGLFQPGLFSDDHKNDLGLHAMVQSSLEKCGEEARKSVCKSGIVLSGGSAKFEGLSTRLSKELKLLNIPENIKVVSPPDMQFSSWIGGSIVGSLSTFESQWMTKAEYDEYGPSELMKRKLPNNISSE